MICQPPACILAATNINLASAVADGTGGNETYGAGRFFVVYVPDDDSRVVLDFNMAYNPPCVWTGYAVCPLPSRDKRLKVRIEAGEKDWAH